MLKSLICDKLIFFLILLLIAACNPTRLLTKDEFMLVKNSVKVTDASGAQFDDLVDLVRPLPNKKFMTIFPIKTSLWAHHQPKIDTVKGITKDTKFNKWMRKNGEPPVLVNESDIERSIMQINLAMFKIGYFNAQTESQIIYQKKQKAKIQYSVTANLPFYIRNLNYQIEIPEYRRIIITDTANSYFKNGMIYNEELLSAERSRIVNELKNKGYYFANQSVVTFLIDTNDAYKHLKNKKFPTISVTIKISLDAITDREQKTKIINRYKFNNVLIYTNYDLNFDKNIYLDTIPYFDFRNNNDSTMYEFVTQKKLKKKSHKLKLIKDYKSRTIAGAIWMKKGDLYTQVALDRTYKKLRDLKNFSITNVSYQEDETLWDSIAKMGTLNTTLKLTRAKQHSVGAGLDIRTDRTSLSANYTNKNIFRRAEYLTLNAYGSVYYYNWINSLIKKQHFDYPIYGEFGANATLEFPRLLMLPKYQSIDFWSYSTSIRLGGSYSQLFSRLNLFVSYTYNWGPKKHLSHSISPIDLATIDSRSSRDNTIIATYPKSYQRKFDKFFLPSAKYHFNYYLPKTKKHNLFFTLQFETVGLLVFTANKLINKEKTWKIFNNYNYGTYEKVEANLRYIREINANNSFATRLNFGLAVPFTKAGIIPFERSFFMGGSNSMRGWTFRQLGPGGYFSEKYIERVGDIKLELNLEYRGTIYKAFKYAIFTDMGNCWLISKYDGMPNAEFNFKNFYKQIAVCLGAGIRLDFNFFILRLDYGLPIYDPSKPIKNYVINKSWVTNKWWNWTQGIQFGIGYAF